MCLFPRFIKNKRYTGYTVKRPKQGTATAVPCDDYRKLYVPIGCGECIECRKQKAQAWKVRLNEEIKVNRYTYFTTLTFSNESIWQIGKENKFITKEGLYSPNDIAKKAIRLFLERWRKKHNKSLKHWFITELGHENTERIHLHGIIFTDFPINNDYLYNIWKYGKSDLGEYCNERTINYIVKYVTKIDIEHKDFKPIILCSAGIGANFTQTYAAKVTYKYKPKESAEYYKLPNGNKVALPIYYRNKFYTPDERDKLWTERLDKKEIYVNGIKMKVRNEKEINTYYNVLKQQQEFNNTLGYGNTNKEWQENNHKCILKKLNN